MPVLIIAESLEAARRVAGAARVVGGMTPKVVPAEEVLGALGADPIGVVATATDDRAALVQRIRTTALGGYTYVLAVTKDPRSLEPYEEGADVTIHGSGGPQLLAAQLAVASRIASTSASQQRRIAVLKDQRRASLSRDERSLIRTKTWNGLERLFENAFAEFLMREGGCSQVVDRLPEATIGATATLSDVTRRLEVGLAVMSDDISGRKIASHLLGGAEADDELVLDMLAEMANVAMGILKAGWMQENFGFTGALPKTRPFRSSEEFLDRYNAQKAAVLQWPEFGFIVAVCLRQTQVLKVHSNKLEEGMILVRDFINSSGAKLVPAGTRLTNKSALKLATVKPVVTVQVCAPGEEAA